MKTSHFNPLHPAISKGVISALAITLLFSLSSCNKEDPSYEKEALRLTAEKASLEAQLEQSQQQQQALQAQLNQAQSAVSSATEKISESRGQIDEDKIKLGFAKAVTDLGAQIEAKHPEYDVESVTFDKMKMPTDFPFSSGVMTTLVSKSTGQKQNLYWEAQGNTQGVWRFANRKKPASAAAATPATPPNVAQNPTPNAQTPPKQPTQPTRPAQPVRRPVAADGNTHIIDWGTLK